MVSGGHTLVGDDKAADGIGVEVDLAGRDQLGGQDIDARQAGERRFGQHRKLAVEPSRHILPHLADDLLDQVVVVQQPLGAGGDFQLLIGEAGVVALGAQEQRFQVPQPMQQVHPIRLAAQDGPGGEAARQVLQAGGLDASLLVDLGSEFGFNARWLSGRHQCRPNSLAASSAAVGSIACRGRSWTISSGLLPYMMKEVARLPYGQRVSPE